MKVPFLFPLPEDEYLRQEEGEDIRLFRMFREGDLVGGPRDVEKMVAERRFVYAILDPQTPACQINKMIPDDPAKRRVPFSEEHVLTFFQCLTRGQIQRDWDDKRKNGGHKRFSFLGEVALPDGKSVELAVSFRRYQQFLSRDVEKFVRVASPLADVSGVHASDMTIAAYQEFRAEGDPKLS